MPTVALTSDAFEHAPVGVATVSTTGQFLTVNQALCDLVGYSNTELLARTFADITHPESVEVDLDHLRQMIAGEIDSYQVEKRYVHARGHFVTVMLSVWLVRNRFREALYFIAQIQDISERTRAETALRESNEKFHQLADNLTDAFWIRSPDMGTIEYVSPAFERIWGRSVASLHANPTQWIEFVVLEDRERVKAAFAALATDAPTLDIEYRIARPTGEIRWLGVRGFQVRDAAGHLTRLTGIVTDITDRRHAEEALRESERRFSDMLGHLDMVALMADQDGKITYCNDALVRLTGWSREEMIGRDGLGFLVPPSIVAEMRDVLAALIAGEPWARHYENAILTRSGAQRLIEWNNSLLRSASGDTIGTASIGHDITERKQIEAQLFQSQKMETVGTLAGGVAHEFNSILTAIIGQSELLIGNLAGSPLATAATEISRAGARAASLTRQLLAHGRKQVLVLEPLDLNRILARMDGTFRHLMGTAIETHVVPSPGLHAVQADAAQLQQVILNVLINARDAMPHGGTLTLETANVTLDELDAGLDAALAPGEYVRLAITDTGSGMAPKVAARVFEPFFTTKAVGEGSGLGLSTSYGIVKQCGGHITVQSEPGRGTTFTIYLPRAYRAIEPAVARLDSTDLPRGAETILLVQRDPALREMAAALLRRLGYTVITAADDADALRLTKQPGAEHVDLVFTEALLPTPFTPSALARTLRETLDQPIAL